MVSNETLYLYTPKETLKRILGSVILPQSFTKVNYFDSRKFPVWHENFQKFTIFHPYRQYIHQMKVENILNSNFRRKSTLFGGFFFKNWIFKNYSLYFEEKKIRT